VAQNMSAAVIDRASRHLKNMTSLPVDGTGVSTFPVSGVWWQWLIADRLLRYGPAVCVCVASVGVVLSVVVWIRLRRHLPTTLLYLLTAMILELLPVYMHCGSYTLKQVSAAANFWTPCTVASWKVLQGSAGGQFGNPAKIFG